MKSFQSLSERFRYIQGSVSINGAKCDQCLQTRRRKRVDATTQANKGFFNTSSFTQTDIPHFQTTMSQTPALRRCEDAYTQTPPVITVSSQTIHPQSFEMSVQTEPTENKSVNVQNPNDRADCSGKIFARSVSEGAVLFDSRCASRMYYKSLHDRTAANCPQNDARVQCAPDWFAGGDLFTVSLDADEAQENCGLFLPPPLQREKRLRKLSTGTNAKKRRFDAVTSSSTAVAESVSLDLTLDYHPWSKQSKTQGLVSSYPKFTAEEFNTPTLQSAEVSDVETMAMDYWFDVPSKYYTNSRIFSQPVLINTGSWLVLELNDGLLALATTYNAELIKTIRMVLKANDFHIGFALPGDRIFEPLSWNQMASILDPQVDWRSEKQAAITSKPLDGFCNKVSVVHVHKVLSTHFSPQIRLYLYPRLALPFVGKNSR